MTLASSSRGLQINLTGFSSCTSTHCRGQVSRLTALPNDGACNTHRKRARAVVRHAANYESGKRLKQAAEEYAEAIQRGVDEDDVVAMQLGATDKKALSEKQKFYMDKIKAKLAKEAEEAQRIKDLNNMKFKQGKSAYSTGQYVASEILFQEALEMEGEYSALGGEIQLWLALAYQANRKEFECIELYKKIEKHHPLGKIKRQAANLRCIMEAPKLTLGDDERITLPILQDQSRYGSRRSNSRAAPRPPPISTKESRYKKSREEIFWENYEPPIPKVLKNRYVLVASGVLATGLAWYSAVLNRSLHHIAK